MWAYSAFLGYDLLPQAPDQLPLITAPGWNSLVAGVRRAEGPGDRTEPFQLLGTNDETPDALDRLQRSIESQGWKRWPANDYREALRFWQGDRVRFLSLSRFPNSSLLNDPTLDYGVSPQSLSGWQAQFRDIYIIEVIHFYSSRPLFD